MRHAVFIVLLFSLIAHEAHANVLPGGQVGDDRVSVGYDPATGEVFWESDGQELEELLITSIMGNFSGDPSSLELCDAVFCQDTDYRIEKLGFTLPIKSGSFGHVAAKNLSQEILLKDWTVSGRLYPSGNFDGSQVDLIYVPEPSIHLAVACVGITIGFSRRRVQ